MIWLFAHSLILSAASVAILAGASLRAAAAVVAIEAVAAFAVLVSEGGKDARRPANAVTSVRLVAGVAALAAVAFAPRWPFLGPMMVFGILAIGEASDFADGIVARRSGPTAFGARLDMETDAFFMLTLSIVAAAWFGVGRWVVLAGLLRYAVAIPFFLLPEPVFGRRFKVYAKIAAGTAATCMLAATFPLAPQGLRSGASAVALALLLSSFGWEALARARTASGGTSGRMFTPGILRSVVTYYGVPFRLHRMKRFYRCFVSPGDLVFDVGAHVGNRVRAFRSLGARVVAIEPQKACMQLLSRLYGGDGKVFLEEVACGSHVGTAILSVPSSHPTLATLSSQWSESIDRHYGDLGIDWDRKEDVRLRTLDDLIAQYGMPSFVKIDVEGFEHLVLEGLNSPIPALSFEFLPAARQSALDSLDAVAGTGPYEFNYSLVERMHFASPRWLNAEEMKSVLLAMAPRDRSGDVYARLTGGTR